MPAWLSGPDAEKAWEKAKKIVKDGYPDLKSADEKGAPRKLSSKFYALVTTIYKNVCRSPKYNCGIKGKKIAAGFDEKPKMSVLLESLEILGER